jgi:DNA-binding HxlR family transcriptional regulator
VYVDPRGLREILEVISHKWDLVILAHLMDRPLRYSELHQRIRVTASDLTEGVLSKALRRLNVNGLIHQRSIGDHHHAWALTPRGRNMIAGLTQITQFHTGTDGPSAPVSAGPPDAHELAKGGNEIDDPGPVAGAGNDTP